MKKKKNSDLATIEVRNASLEINTAEEENEMILEGYASVVNRETTLYEIDGISYKEVIDREAFKNSDFSMCCMKYNHENSVPILARVRGGSLVLEADDYGLKFKAKLFNTSSARDVYTLVKEGGLDKCSFAFTVKNSEYNSETHTRRILEIDKVFDVSVVDIPAYEETSVQARSFFELERKKELDKLENEKRLKIKLLSYK